MEEAIKSGVDSLDLVSKQIRAEVSRMPEDEIREILKEKKLNYRGSVKALREQLLNVRLREHKEKSIVSAEEAGEVDVEEVELPVNDKFERAQEHPESQEATLKVVHSPTIIEAKEDLAKRAEAKRIEIETRLSAREAADRLEQEIHRLSPEPPKETAYSSSVTLSGGKRIAYRNVDGFPFGKPKRTIEPVKKITEQEKPKVEIPKETTPIVLPERKPLMHIDDLGKSKEQNTAVSKKDEEIIQSIILAEEIVGEDNKNYYNENKDRLEMEAFRRIGAPGKPIFHEGDSEEAGEIADAEPIDKDLRSPEKTLSEKDDFAKPENVSAKKIPSQEARNGNIDGLVEFNLNKLNINKTELVREMPEFFTLKKNEQIYVLQKLQQKVDRDLDRDSIARLDADDKANTKGGWIGKIGRNMFKKSRLTEVRKYMSNKMKEEGLASYKDRLSDLTGVVERRGIEMEFENGRLVLQFITHKGENPKHQKLIDDFNNKASKFADAPYEWSVEHAAPALKAQFKLFQSSFDKARQALIAYESKIATDENRPAKLAEIMNVDAEIEMGQFLSHNAGIAGAVNRFIKSNPYLEGKIGMAVGIGVREFGKNALAFGGGVLGSAITGGFTSWIRKRTELRQLEEDQRAGKNIGDAKGVKKAIDIAGYTDKINKLIKQVENAKTPESKARTLETLKTRISIAQDRIHNLGAVNFGGGRNELANQAEFTRAIKKANVLFMENSPVADDVAEMVYIKFNEKYLHDDDKSAERKTEVIKAFKRGAIIGAGGFVVGYVAADLIAHDGEAVRGAFQKVEDISKKIYGNAIELGDKMNGVFSNVGESVRENMKVVSDENIIRAGKGVIASAREGIADVQNELNRAEFYANRGSVSESPNVIRSIKPVSENPINIVEPDNTFVKTPVNTPDFRPEIKSEPVNFPENMPRPDGGWSSDLENLDKITESVSNPVAETPVGARGLIGAIKDLQRELTNHYGENMPEKLREFAEGNPDRLAIDMGGYRPGEEAESISLPPGSSIVATSDGQIKLKVPEGYTEPKFFDSGATGNAPEVAEVVPNKNVPVVEQAGHPEIDQVKAEQPKTEFDFKEHMDKRLAEGWTHEAKETGGDIFTAEVDPQAAKEYAPEFYPEEAKSPEVTNVATESPESVPAGPETLQPENPSEVYDDSVATEEDLTSERTLEESQDEATINENTETRNIVKTGRDAIKPDSKIYLDAVSKYGKAKIDGNVMIFDKGSVGFYAESRDLEAAMRQVREAVRLNDRIVGRLQEQIATQMKDGTFRIVNVYKKL